ncbi:MAG: ATP-binding cassette domain-containing protein [bacterium]|jgi:ATP-binding cassette, subfamily F, member 3|nr:ATP-binding cassette domain-containing protein [bacterium]
MPLPLLEGQHLRKRYGLQTVLEDLSFLITEKQKIALIGRNGAGKSTLIKLITGAEEVDGGTVLLHAHTRLGIVKQHEVLPDDVSGLDYLVEKSGKADWEVQKLGASFGLTQEMLAKPPAALSGGYQMRVKLTDMLLGDPNLLILDEPVNYLDLQTLLLLEQFLQNFRGSFIIAAHDRTFLQNTCTHTFEIERGDLLSFAGGVQEYFAYKEEQHQLKMRANKRLKREIAHHQAFVDRFRFKRSLASRAQSKLKHITKLRRQIVSIDSDLATTRIAISCPRVVDGPAVRADGLQIGYGDFVVANGVEFEIQRGQKVVIAGENGRGKSTLLKTIAGKIPMLDGTYKWWHRADIGYYDQMTSASLDGSETVLKHLTRMAPGHVSGEGILMMAGNFLFTGDDLDKPVSVLSGGERARLALAGILLKEHNVLLLDEPTNHLDVETTEALALALKEYKGTVMFVSHARTFVHALADEIYEMRAGRLRRYMGTYEEYVEDLEDVLDIATPAEEVLNEASVSRAERAELHTRIKEHQRSQQRVERKMKKFDTERSEILAYFFENPTDYAPTKAQRLEELNVEIEELETGWLKDEEAIVSLRAQL